MSFQHVTADAAGTMGPAADISPIVLCAVDYDPTRNERAYVKGHRGVRLGAVDVQQYEGFGVHCGNRSAQHIAADHLDDYLVSIPLHVHVDFAQTEGRGSIEPGAFALLSTSMPFAASISGLRRHEAFSGLNLRVSGHALRQRLPIVDSCCGRAIRTRSGAGVIMKGMCDLVLAEGRHLNAAEATRFGSMLIDAVVTAISEAPEVLASTRLSQRGTPIRIWKEAIRHIDEQLSNPGLDTDTVAQHCHVSKRYLQAMFADMGATVSGVIREARLQRCREALRNPALGQQSVAQIAMHWGFNDLPNFCRLYKTRFDVSPGRDRGDASVLPLFSARKRA